MPPERQPVPQHHSRFVTNDANKAIRRHTADAQTGCHAEGRGLEYLHPLHKSPGNGASCSGRTSSNTLLPIG